MSKELKDAVEQLLASAQAAFTTSDDLADIKQSTDALTALAREWQQHSERVRSTVTGLLKLVQSRCKHVGAQRGYNDRDGSWMNSCPTCGASE
jgi:hypothetical protein